MNRFVEEINERLCRPLRGLSIISDRSPALARWANFSPPLPGLIIVNSNLAQLLIMSPSAESAATLGFPSRPLRPSRCESLAVQISAICCGSVAEFGFQRFKEASGEQLGGGLDHALTYAGDHAADIYIA